MLVGCAHRQPASRLAQLPFVETSVANEGAIQPSQQLPGIIAPYQNVAIESTLTEPADAVYVRAGDRVRRGEVLAQLDTADLRAALASDLAQAQSDAANTTHDVYAGSLSIAQGNDSVTGARTALSQAEANLDRDQTDLNRYQTLLAQGYIAEQQVAQQQTTVNDDRQTVQSDQAALASAISNAQANGTSIAAPGLQSSTIQSARAMEQVAIAQANQERVAIEKATIDSPIDGVVVNRNLNPGEYPGTRQLFTLQQVNPIYAVLRGSGTQIAQIANGSSATISPSDGLRPALHGKVVGVLNQIAPGSTDFQVMVLLQNLGNRLRPGVVVEGNVALPVVSGVRIPETAFTDDNHDAVMTVAGGTVKTVDVSEVADDGTTAIVSGLSAGTRVISNGQTSVGDGEKVAYR